MTTATIDGKTKSISKYAKAASLNVYEVSGVAGYIVSSGSDANKAYRVSADCEQCSCDSRVLCSHRIAAQTFQADKAAAQPVNETCDCCFKHFTVKPADVAWRTTCYRCL